MNRLKQCRKLLGLTKSQVCEMTGIKKKRLKYLESIDCISIDSDVSLIANAYHIDLEYFKSRKALL